MIWDAMALMWRHWNDFIGIRGNIRFIEWIWSRAGHWKYIKHKTEQNLVESITLKVQWFYPCFSTGCPCCVCVCMCVKTQLVLLRFYIPGTCRYIWQYILFNSTPGRCCKNVKRVISEPMLWIEFTGTFCEIAFRWMQTRQIWGIW